MAAVWVMEVAVLCRDNILNAQKPAPGKDIKIVEKNGNVKV